jgi:uncharacterized coiled-coil protein SlyX
VKRIAEATQVDKNAKLESLVKMQDQKIAELKAACTNLKLEKENVTASYRRLSEKHKALLKMQSRINLNLHKPMRQSWPESRRSWISKPKTTPTIA